MKTLYFNTRDELIKIDLNCVVYFKSDANYTHVIFINGCKAMLLTSLIHIEKLIDNELQGMKQPFIRIGKQYIVNSSYIFQINIPKQTLILSDCFHKGYYELSISKAALKQIKDLYKVTNGNNNR